MRLCIAINLDDNIKGVLMQMNDNFIAGAMIRIVFPPK